MLGVGKLALGSYLEIGADEGWELQKASLWAKGVDLYSPTWNNQPPVYTLLLGSIFRTVGNDVGIARGLSLCFAALLAFSIFKIVQADYGIPAGLLAVFTVITAPQVCKLSVSTMLELPAFATALTAALWIRRRSTGIRSQQTLIFSGVLLGVALGMKLTAALMAPAIACEIVKSSSTSRAAASSVMVWLIAIASTFLLIVSFTGMIYSQMWRSLFSVQSAVHAAEVGGTTVLLNTLRDHPDGLLISFLGLVMIFGCRRYCAAAFVLTLFLTVGFVHFFRRPYWEYYYIHIAVPLAMLGGIGVGEIQRWLCSDKLQPTVRALGNTGIIIFISIIVTFGILRTDREIERLSYSPRIDSYPVIQIMRKYKEHTRFAYSIEPIFLFHSGLLVIPELAVLAPNRFWSGEIDDRRIWFLIERRMPEQIMLMEEIDSKAQAFLKQNYTHIYSDPQCKLFILKTIKLN